MVRNNFIYIFVLGLFFLLHSFFIYQKTQTFNFADENEHVVIGWEIAQNSKVLYQDLTTNHQPIPILTGAVFNKIFGPLNAFMLFERLRFSMIAISFIGALFVTLRFKLTGLLASIFIEIIKYYFLGYHLLAESLIVYPLIFLAGLLLRKTKIKYFDDFACGLCLFLIAFNLIPCWPFLALSCLYYIFKSSNKVETWLVLMSGFLIFTLMLFSQINVFSWFEQTISNNYLYLMPYEVKLGLLQYFSMIFLPLSSLFHLNQPVAIYYMFLTVFYATLFILNKKFRLQLTFYYILIILLNLRVTTLNTSFYGAFHLLPQAAFFTMVVMSFVSKKFIFLLLIPFAILASSLWKEAMTANKLNDHFIQYGDEESIGMAISAIKEKDDRLLAGPQSGFINYFSQTKLATKQNAYLDWAYRTPAIKSNFEEVRNINPPEYVYFPKSNNPFFLDLEPILQDKYVKIERTFGDSTSLYILKSKISRVPDQKWRLFESLKYKKPQI